MRSGGSSLGQAAEPALDAPAQAPRGLARLALVAGLDGSSLKAATRWLSASGFDVAVAGDVSGALEAAARRRPDVVLADLALRDALGRNLCQRLRERPELCRIPVLALCASHREASAALEAGAAELLERPFDWHVGGLRAERLARLAEVERDLGSARAEAERVRKALEDERRDRHWRDHFDALTGLPDGERLERALESALASATADSQVALALFEIEHLVVVNGRLGRARANSVLQQVAQRLVAGLRSEDVRRVTAGPSMSLAARLGGGLFAVMLTGLPGPQEAKASVRLLLDRLAGRYFAGGEETLLPTSVGVALAPPDGRTAEALLQKAELAASEAVAAGGGIQLYEQSSHRVSERTRAILRLLPDAVARGDFQLHYQPLLEGPATEVRAAEALLRWECPQLGGVPPAEFVPLAEEAGLMVELGSWVLRTACRQMRAWLDQGLRPSRIAVNVSLCQLVRGDLAGVVDEILAETGMEPSLLELELSERGVLRSDPEILRQLHAIRSRGVRLAIDDFGTGNSAVAYLKQFPIDVLKIDQSFVRGVAASAEDAAITSATIAMARQLGLRVVAEGVEEQGQMDFLRRHGCTEYQGFLFSPAVPAEAFAALMRGGLRGGVA